MSERVLGLVPARAGSTGIVDKNVRPLAGRPLLAYAVEAARASGVVDRLILTTDSARIAELGRGLGLEVPFMRPADLAADDTPMIAVVEHAIEQLAATADPPSIVVLLQPTSPLRRGDHIARAVHVLRQTGADAVASVVELPRHLSPDYVMRIEDGHLVNFLPEGRHVTRRQDARTAYQRDGSVYAFRADTVRRYHSIYGERCVPLVMDRADALSIDTEEDWREAERRLAARSASA